MAYYFISDLHLSAHQPQLVGVFKHFLSTIATDATHLYILGDLFDAWIGDDEDSQAAADIKQLLKTISQSGISCYFLRGNRDFLVGERFCQETGFALLQDIETLSIFDESTVLLHGDTLCTDDKDYMQFRAQVRNAAWQQQILSIPLAQRRVMAAKMREQSSSMNSLKAEDIMDVNAQAVEQALQDSGATTMIHGHTHRPSIHPLANNKRRIVLGDWHNNSGWYLKVTENDWLLQSFTTPN